WWICLTFRFFHNLSDKKTERLLFPVLVICNRLFIDIKDTCNNFPELTFIGNLYQAFLFYNCLWVAAIFHEFCKYFLRYFGRNGSFLNQLDHFCKCFWCNR